MPDKPEFGTEAWVIAWQNLAWNSIPFRCQSCDWEGPMEPQDYIGAVVKMAVAEALEFALDNIHKHGGASALGRISIMLEEIRDGR